MAWSYLIKENAVYNFAEHLLVGMAVGRGIAYTIEVQLQPRIVDGIIGQGRWSLIIPAIIGCLIYFRFVRGYEWVSRICMAVWIGYGAGNFLAFNPATYMPQIFDSFFKLDSIDNVIYFLVVISIVWYFIFTVRKDSGFGQQFSMIGRYALMIAFGSAYGSITMAYLSLIIGQLQIILRDTLHLVK
jgi:hypothetical protein